MRDTGTQDKATDATSEAMMTIYADQRAHDVALMTAGERADLDRPAFTEAERAARASFCPHGSTVRLTAVAGLTGTWEVWISDLGRIGTWQATDVGARVTDLVGEVVAVVSTLAGTQCAAVAGLGRQAAQWSDLAHKVLAGNCEIS